MKINWFSPLPPAKTDIANYTMRILSELQKFAEVILWTDQILISSEIMKTFEVRRYALSDVPWVDLNKADVSFFNIGNNPSFHCAIWEISRKHPGIVILHDTHLQHFFCELYINNLGNKSGYVEKMQSYYGETGAQIAQEYFNGSLKIDQLSELCPLTPLALENSLGVIVHSEKAFFDLKELRQLPICCAPLPFPSGRNISKVNDTPKPPTPPFKLIIFGYLGPNRRLDSVLEALAGLSEKGYFTLDIFGELWDVGHIKTTINSLGLSNQVQIHGFVPIKELEYALTTAHLAINLRFPTMGEASATQLTIWANGLPSLVSKVGWYAELPDDTVAFVRPDHEVTDIQNHLRAFLDNPCSFGMLGDNGLKLLQEQHLPSAYAENIINFASTVISAQPFLLSYFYQRIGDELSLFPEKSLCADNIKKIALEIQSLSSELRG